MPDTEMVSPSALQALHEAALAIAANTFSLPDVLNQIVASARQLGGARYAALGIPGKSGEMATFVYAGMPAEDAAHIPHFPLGEGLLGALLREPTAIRTSRISDDPRSAGFPTGHPRMENFLGVPVMAQGEILGNLYLAEKEGADAFTVADQAVIELLAAHAAIAIQMARLWQSSQEHEQQLELRDRQMAALRQATLAIVGELSLEKVLQSIVDSARELVGAEYAALGVPNADGHLDAFVFSGMSAQDAAHIPHLPHGLGLLGAIIRDRRPIRIPRIVDDPRSVGFPPGHPPMDSFLGLPILVGSKILGNLYLANKLETDAFSAMDQEMVTLLAAHAAVAIQNARLYEQVGRLAIVEERSRIGMDLHDGVIQSIYAVGLTLESARLSLMDDPQDAMTLIDGAIEGLNDAIRDIRNFILDLRPRRFEGDLGQGLGRLSREFQANTMVPVTLKVPAKTIASLPPSVARAMFLTAQEALANIARHARARHVAITVTWEVRRVTLMVTDDGRGFNVKSRVHATGHGLSNMRARAEEQGGSFTIDSAPGQGTTICLELPL
ncbi:MAG: GAF domain-containing sensor histidine kinase [Anaerolineales bacterium]|nr:GAF domain-containing sensor histidine kinase [Anaerolineales bacterium]MCB8950774.1 GAF domain-containing sensor histidine kinase [Ardenticatenales bacterium]